MALQNQIHTRTLALFLAIVALTVGGGIYILYRPETLLMFRWTDALHLNRFVENIRQLMSIYTPSDFIKYSLPDGLWSIAYFLIMLSIWGKIGKESVAWLCLMPIFALVSEFMQLTPLIPGRFDVLDVVCYSVPLIMLIAIIIIKKCTRKKSYLSLQ